MDVDRVGAYIRRQGGELIDSRRNPFCSGCFGEKNSRIDEVRYRDGSGDRRDATVGASLFSGVYLTDDRIIQPGTVDKAGKLELEMGTTP
ncbi:MAG: hypothetical protein AAF989_03255 [Planctomycetota bacterium]